MSREELLARLAERLPPADRLVIVGHNLHSVYLFHTEPHFADVYEGSDIALLDGMPVLSLLNRQRRREGQPALSRGHRLGSTDWVLPAVALSHVRRVCVLGATADSNDALIERLSRDNADAEFLGIPGDPWDATMAAEISSRVARFGPDLTLVGMGMPLQEAVFGELTRAGVTGVIAMVGGAIDQLSGAQLLAPRWIGRMGVEWLWRLATQPRRLAYRYLVEPIKLWRLLAAKAAEK